MDVIAGGINMPVRLFRDMLGEMFMLNRLCFILLAMFVLVGNTWAADNRQKVEMPAMMQDHMLANMRDHLKSLDLILAALAKGDAKGAADLAETRLGMSSLDAHGAEHMAPMMPVGMREIGTSLHHAASRFAVTVRDAELDPPEQGSRKVFAALQEVTAACEACHAGYRLR
jgi:hypothetical protein